jgi:O-antigen/teichoic acid export membrane protein
MTSTYRDLLKHSGVYGVGQIITRVVSVAMLPVQTRFLTPSDYGVIAVIDLTFSVLAIVINGGLASAINRHHHDVDTEEGRQTVWWTGLIVAMATTATITVPAFFFRDVIARATLGASAPSGGTFYALMLTTLWFAVISNLTMLYFRIRKWSSLIVGLSVGSLLLNVTINVYLLYQGWGIAAILTGNLLTFVGTSLLQLGIVIRSGSRFGFDWRLAGTRFGFAWPLLLTMLLATAMHQADRYLLRQYVSLEAVGVYSLAYQVGQGINALILAPFGAIWGVAIYEIAREPNAKQIYADLFRYFVYGLLLLLLGVSLFADPLVKVFAPPSYAGAAALVPIICLAFVFFSMEAHFRVPALLAKRTLSLVPAYALAAAANVGLNLWLLPIHGIIGAAWTSVATYAIFAAVNLVQNRRIERYDYPLVRCAAIMTGMVGTVSVFQMFTPTPDSHIRSIALPALAWMAWAAALLYPMASQYLARGPWSRPGTQQETL